LACGECQCTKQTNTMLRTVKKIELFGIYEYSCCAQGQHDKDLFKDK